MMRFGRLVFVPVLALTPLELPSVASAQRFGFALGTNVAEGPGLPYQDFSSGFAGQASLGYRLAPRLRVRFDALVSHFTAGPQQISYLTVLPCPSPGCSGTAHAAPVGGVGVATLGVNELIDVLPAAPGGPGFYVIAGVGTYYLFQHPTSPALVRVGLSGGAGVELRLEGNSAVFVEARYHGLANAPTDARWFVPVTVGMRF